MTMAWLHRLGTRVYFLLALLFSAALLGHPLLLELAARTEHRLFDTLMSHRVHAPAADPRVVILDIDEASLAALAPEYGRWPWPNRVLGDLVDALESRPEARPRAIVFDILFSDKDTLRPDSDVAFNAAIARSTSTYFPMLRLDPRNDALSRIPVGALPGVVPLSPGADPSPTVAIVLPKVPAALEAGRLGTHQVEPDQDAVIRRFALWTDHAGWRIPSLPLRLAQDQGWPAPHAREMLLNWRGPPFSYRYLSFAKVHGALVRGQDRAAFDEALRDAIVIIGSTAPSLFDIKATPMAHIHPGVEVLATAIDNLRHDDHLRAAPRAWMVGAALALIWAMALSLHWRVPIERFDAVFTGLQVGLVVLAYALLNTSHWYVDASIPLSLGLMYFAAARVYHGVTVRRLAAGTFESRFAGDAGALQVRVLAWRLPGASERQRRALRAAVERLLARQASQVGRATRWLEEAGLPQAAMSDLMLVCWAVPPDRPEAAQPDAQALRREIAEAVARAGAVSAIQYGEAAGPVAWTPQRPWTSPVLALMLEAIRQTLKEEEE